MNHKKISFSLIAIISIVLLISIAVLADTITLIHKRSESKSVSSHADDLSTKTQELSGTPLCIPRSGDDDINALIYYPYHAETMSQPLPVIFQIHGGGFISGSASLLDTQSKRIANAWNSIIVTVDYKLLDETHSIDYATQEIVDSVTYFKMHADDYHIDKNKISLMGYSAGGYHVIAATLQLLKKEIPVYAQILCYAYIGDIDDLYKKIEDSNKPNLPPALFILADSDSISDNSLQYQKLLQENGIETCVKKYDNSMHGFIEENNPEYDSSAKSKSPEQESMARDSQDFIGKWLER